MCILSLSVLSDSLRPHALQPTRPLCPWGFSRQEYWNGLPCPPPGGLPKPGIEPRPPKLQADSLLTRPPGKPTHACKIVLKILQATLQQHMNQEFPDVQAGYRKRRGTRGQVAEIHWIIKKAREFQKNDYLFFTDYAKAFDYVDHNELWKTVQEMGIPDHLTCLLRNLYAGQEATVRTGHGTTDWFQIGKGVRQGCILLPCLFNFYANCIM